MTEFLYKYSVSRHQGGAIEGPPYNPLDHQSTIVLRGLRGIFHCPPLGRETPVSQTVNVCFCSLFFCCSYLFWNFSSRWQRSFASDGKVEFLPQQHHQSGFLFQIPFTFLPYILTSYLFLHLFYIYLP